MEKFLEIQKHVKENQSDLKDYLRDLDSWEKNIKLKEDKLKNEKVVNSQSDLPPIRNNNKPKKKKKKIKPDDNDDEEQKKGEKKRISSYDYRAWDKFDVDKVCNEIDGKDNVEQNSNSSEYETDSEAEQELQEISRKQQQAITEKDNGNSFFKKGNYSEALKCYETGLEYDGNNFILHANKAMSLIKLNRFEEAEVSCTFAISLDYTYVKAYARRGSARIELGKLDEAKKDFKQVLNLEPDNKQAISELRRINKIIADKEREKEPSNIVKPINKLPYERSQKPLQRIFINEVGSGSDGEEEIATETVVNGESRVPVIATNERGSTKSPPLKESRTASPEKVPANKKIVLPGDMELPPLPTTSFQFLRDWKKLQPHPQILYKYLKGIPTESYPKLFQESLDSTILENMINLLNDLYVQNGDAVYPVLKSLTNVKRFSMNVMFLSPKLKKVLLELFDYMKSNQNEKIEDPKEVDILKNMFL